MKENTLKCLPQQPEIIAWTANDEKFAKDFEKKVQSTIAKHRLFSKKDKILVAVSGGKDSTTALFVLNKLGYPVEGVTVDAHIGCYSDENLRNLREQCKKLNIQLHEIPFRKAFGASLCYIRDYLKEKGHSFRSCTVCGILRRYLLNKKARELGADVLVLGHNLDDEAQSVIMNLMKNRPELNARLGPRVDSAKNSKLVPRVKPLYFITEQDIVRYSKLQGFNVKYTRCPCASDGFRFAVRDFLNACAIDGKGKIISTFLKKRNLLQKNLLGKNPAYCENCGEPANNSSCSACRLIGLLHKPLKTEKLSRS
jgi:uncharacterized protein (TIGR00269 family)